MQETSAAALGLEATIDAETQPFGIGEFRAVAAVGAVGKQAESRGEKARGERGWIGGGGHKNKNFEPLRSQLIIAFLLTSQAP